MGPDELYPWLLRDLADVLTRSSVILEIMKIRGDIQGVEEIKCRAHRRKRNEHKIQHNKHQTIAYSIINIKI